VPEAGHVFAMEMADLFDARVCVFLEGLRGAARPNTVRRV